MTRDPTRSEPPARQGRGVSPAITLLREVSDGPVAGLFAGVGRIGGVERLVALKVLRHRRPRDVDQLLALREMGRRLDAIGHRHVHAATELAVVEGRLALVSAWVEGTDLLDWMELLRERDTPIPARVVCDVIRGAASALDAGLQRVSWGESGPLGAQHRDVKPSNVMVSRDGEVKLVDFGTGLTTLGGRDGRIVASRAGLGRYLSPGRRAGKRGGPSSDVYALGIVGVELLIGRWLQRVRDTNPAHDRHLAEVVAALPDLGMRAPQDDRSLRTLLLRMVAFDGEARPSAAEVAQTLRTLSDRCPGPSLESFAHEHAPTYGLGESSTAALPEATLVDGDDGFAALSVLPVEESPEDEALAAAAEGNPDEEASVFVSASVVDDDDDLLYLPVRGSVPLRAVDTGPIAARAADPPRRSDGALSLVAAAGFGAVLLAAAAGLALGLALGLLVAL